MEREARSVALEQAYVHEVYHQMGGSATSSKQNSPWPRVTQFLNQLEPGSIVCDVGCGSGKYLTVNPLVFKLGADRCSRLTETAREAQNEVLVCDNLALPFRDESFDAVLSIAVVHHFATTERRVGALKELTRILRLGGRLVISVWAMEQRHRKFESQDVLVPWHRPEHLSTPSLELTPTTTSEDEVPHHHPYLVCAAHTSDSDSCQSLKGGKEKKRESKKRETATSPSSSSLSSPNETCYSFVRRALQKLAGGKRSSSRSKPWFLDSWTSCTSKEPPPRRYDPEGCEDIQDLPIELRRLEEDNDVPMRRQTFTCTNNNLFDTPLNHKSKSLSDIININQKSIVRSQSSVPSLELINREAEDTFDSESEVLLSNKPKLVKQKQSLCDEDMDGEERDQATDMKVLVKSLPEFKTSGSRLHRKGNVFKQSSMNEELMSTERLKEKERVKQNIQKQASLNEELIYNRHNGAFDSLKDTLFSASTAKRFQLLKNGLTSKLKSSTTGIEKVAGASIKNGFVRMLQGWTGSDQISVLQPTHTQAPHPNPPEIKTLIFENRKDQPNERRHSREDGSDSSKDSSLQSDTSVDSEDSFASVIFIPKHDQLDQQSNNTSPTLQSNPASPQPSSPKIKFPPPISPKMKNSPQITFGMSSHPSSPKLKHSGTLLTSPTPPSPKVKYFSQPTSPRPYQTTFITSPTTRASFKLQSSITGSTCSSCKTVPTFTKSSINPYMFSSSMTSSSSISDSPKSEAPVRHITKTQSLNDRKSSLGEDSIFSTLPYKFTQSASASPLTQVSVALVDKVCPKDLAEKLKPVQDILRSKSSTRPQFPLVRRASTMSGRVDSPTSRTVPRLLSLEIFNPETDDMDSDSSGLSSPDSVGSVISIKNDEGETTNEATAVPKDSPKFERPRTSGVGAELTSLSQNVSEDTTSQHELKALEPPASPSRLSPLLEAAADVASSLEETVGTVIQSSPNTKRKQLQRKGDPWLALHESQAAAESVKSSKHFIHSSSFDNARYSVARKSVTQAPPEPQITTTENEECRQHLTEFAEKLSAKLLAEIDKYSEESAEEASKPLQQASSKSLEVEPKPNQQSKLGSGSERVKCEGATSEDWHVEHEQDVLIEPDKSQEVKFPMKLGFTSEDCIPLLQQDFSSSSTISINSIKGPPPPKPLVLNSRGSSVEKVEPQKTWEDAPTTEVEGPGFGSESSDDSTESDSIWTDSRRNTILPNGRRPSTSTPIVPEKVEKPVKEELPKREILLASFDSPRKPSISVEVSDALDYFHKEKEDATTDGNQLGVGLSVDSSEAGDVSERTGSSSDGSRSGSRRDTIQISDSGSVLSLRPGLSIESTDAGDISDRTGSDGSRDSRRDTISLSDITSYSQNSMLRPGNSIESSDPGDLSERTGSDLSRQNTSSAGKTPSTASFASDKASDCSKDARFADRRMARCDGRSSSEEIPLPKSCTHKLIRQGASNQESTEYLNKIPNSQSSISGSTSQDSLLSDSGGGAIMFHRYYHVFREGELDQLIEQYVENLHIISSYYDHANWCIIAEKVQNFFKEYHPRCKYEFVLFVDSYEFLLEFPRTNIHIRNREYEYALLRNTNQATKHVLEPKWRNYEGPHSLPYIVDSLTMRWITSHKNQN